MNMIVGTDLWWHLVRSIPLTTHSFSAGADNSWGNNRHTNFRHLSFPKNITDMEDVILPAVFEWFIKD